MDSSGSVIFSTKLVEEDINMVTKAQALDIAHQECVRRRWPWNENTVVKRGLFVFRVWGGGRKGGNAFKKVRKKDGAILVATMTPR